MSFFFQYAALLFNFLSLAIFIRAILSFFPIDPANPLVLLVHQMTEPVLAPLRRIVPRIGMIDLTPLVAIIVLQLMSGVMARGVG